MEWWSDGVLEELNCLKNGVMECWSIGVMGRMGKNWIYGLVKNWNDVLSIYPFNHSAI